MAQYVRSTIAGDRLRWLCQRSDGPGLLQLLGHGLGLTLTGLLVLNASSPLALTLAKAAHRMLLVFLLEPLHETIHRTAFRSRWLNALVSEVCGVLLVLPPRYFRAFHLEHHRYTQDPARDPELPGAGDGGIRRYLWCMSGLDYWLGNLRVMLARAQGRVQLAWLSVREQRRLRIEARAYLSLYGAVAALSVASGSTLALSLWLVPALLGQPWLRLYLFAEHADCPRTPDMLSNSRTVHTTPLLRWLAWNMPYHAEHHAYAAIPFHALPDAHRELGPALASITVGYWRVHRDWLVAPARRGRVAGAARGARYGI